MGGPRGGRRYTFAIREIDPGYRLPDGSILETAADEDDLHPGSAESSPGDEGVGFLSAGKGSARNCSDERASDEQI